MIKNTLLLLVSLLIALLIMEMVVRLLAPTAPTTMDFFRLTRTEYYQRDPVVGWKPRPNVVGVHDQPGSFQSRFSTNSFGLRDMEPADDSAGRRRRIVVLGDSFAWGWGVNDGEIFTDRLEAFLPDTEIVNLGVTGYSTQQQRLLLQELGLGFDPDMIIVAVCQNDVYEASRDFLRPPAPLSDSKTPPSSVKAYLNEHLATYRLLTQAINSNRTLIKLLVGLGIKEELGGYESLDGNLRPSLEHYPPELEESWELAERALTELANVAESHGIPLVVVAVPALQSVVPEALSRSLIYTRFEPQDFDLDKPYRRFAALSETLGAQFIQPLDAFRAEIQGGAKLYFDGDMHFNPAGHDLFARIIAAGLAQEK